MKLKSLKNLKKVVKMLNSTYYKKMFSEIVPQVLAGNMVRADELAELLTKYTWSYSRLKNILVSDINFLYCLAKPFESTKEMNFGNILHSIVLGQKMPENMVFKRVNARTKDGKKVISEIKKKGKVLIDPSELSRARKCADALYRDEACKSVLTMGGYREHEAVGEFNGLKIGGILDLVTNVVGEVKTSASVNPEEFMRLASKFGYPLQAAIYKRLGKMDVVYPTVASSEPYETALFIPTPDYMAMGEMMLNETIDKLHCLIAKLFNGESIGYGEQPLMIPGWERKKLESWKDENA